MAVSKTVVRVSVPGVRIPPLPPDVSLKFENSLSKCFIYTGLMLDSNRKYMNLNFFRSS